MLHSRQLVNVKWLGLINYESCLNVQRKYLNEIIVSSSSSNSNFAHKLLLLEHYPVYTVGIRNRDYSESDEIRLRKLGADFVKTDRGGLITFHGPGQLVAYPILCLKKFHPAGSVKWYVCALEKILVKVCQNLGLSEAHAPGHPLTGVWIADRKIAAIGIHVKRYVTSHGIALNCDVDLDWFRHIVPCGLKDVEVTSLSKELNRKFTINESVEPFLNSFSDQFQCDFEFDVSFSNKFLDNSFCNSNKIDGS